MNEEIALLINSLNDEAKNILVSTDESGNMTLNTSKFSEAISYATPESAKNIIKIFLLTLCENGSQWQKVGVDKINPLMDRLIKLFYEIGIKQSENPYIEFIQKAMGDLQINLTDRDFVDLINVYADEVVDYEDLVGKGKEGFDHILFNKSIYGNDKAYRYVQIWKWLSNPNNLKKMNWQEIKDAELSNMISNVADQMINLINDNQSLDEDTAHYYRDALMYKDGNKGGEVNSITTLEEILNRGSIGGGSSAQKSTNKSASTRDALTKAISNSNLSNGELVSTLKDILSDLGIRL